MLECSSCGGRYQEDQGAVLYTHVCPPTVQVANADAAAVAAGAPAFVQAATFLPRNENVAPDWRPSERKHATDAPRIVSVGRGVIVVADVA